MATTIQRLMDWREDTAMDAIDPDTAGLIWDYYDEQTAINVIASLVGVQTEVVEMIIENGRGGEHYIPTEDEIRERCREIQREWTREERRQRQVVKPVHWMPALCTFWEADRDE